MLMQDKALEGLLMVVQSRCNDHLKDLETRPHEQRFREDILSLLDIIEDVRREEKDPDEGFLDDEDWKHRYDSVVPKQPIINGTYTFISDGRSQLYASAVVVSRTPEKALVVTGSRCVQAKNYLLTDRGKQKLLLAHIDKDVTFFSMKDPPKMSYLHRLADLAQIKKSNIVCHAGKFSGGLMLSYGKAAKVQDEHIYTGAKISAEMLGGPAIVYERGVPKLLGITIGQGHISTVAPALRRLL
jgi:hypothetical protein